jgi:MFS family permease
MRALFQAGNADFWRLWIVGFIVFVVRWFETVAVGVIVYERTGSAFLVAMMTMLRLLPMGLLGAFMGAWAERIERRWSLLCIILCLGMAALTLALLAWADRLEVWHLALACFLNGLGWAADNPVRRVMIGDAVGANSMGAAMSLDVGASNASRMAGPAMAGFLLAYAGIEGVFAVSAGLYAIALIAAWSARYRNGVRSATGSVLAQIAEGLRLVRTSPRLVGTLLVTVIVNVFAFPFTSMIPVVARDQLGLGPEGVGVLASMDGLGAFLGALSVALFVRPAWYGRIYCWGVLLYMTMLTAFALSPDPVLAGGALMLTGMGQAGFATMQATLVYLASPPEMRSRILGVLSVCVGSGPLGFVAIGMLADLIGPHWATAASGTAGLMSMALTRRYWRTV